MKKNHFRHHPQVQIHKNRLHCRNKTIILFFYYTALVLSGVLVTVTVISGVVIIVLITVFCILWRRLKVINSKTESHAQGRYKSISQYHAVNNIAFMINFINWLSIPSLKKRLV